ncbi:MAG: hypothetical protein U0996_02780 [Planctomycetaceae bacterium]
MRCCRFTRLSVFLLLTTFAGELRAQNSTSASIARQRFNQVFVKVIMPVTAHTPKQDGPAVESWVADQLKEQGALEYFAVTDWVPVCDGLLADDDVDNRVWNGQLAGRQSGYFCPVDGDLPERKDGRVTVVVAGWDPGGGHEAKFILEDEPGVRAVEPVLRPRGSGERKVIPGEKPLAYVAVLIGPPQSRVTSHSDNE